MGWRDAFSYDRPAQIWREHAGLSTYENGGKRLFALHGHTGAGNDAYEAMAPFRWGGTPVVDGRFPTPDRKARLVRGPANGAGLTSRMAAQPQYGALPRSMAYDDAYWPVAEARQAPAGAPR